MLFPNLTIISCNSGYQQNIEGFAPRTFCLDILQTEKENNIKIGKGTLTLNKDMTFSILNDSAKYSNLTGEWDLCCEGSDWGNYVFKVKGLKDWEQASPNLYVLIGNKKMYLYFTTCEK